MENYESLYSGNAWFKERLAGPEGHLWKRARKMFLFKQDLSSALNLFKFDYKAIKTLSRPTGDILQGSRDTTLTSNSNDEFRPGQSWADDAKNSIHTLLDRIVTRWMPTYLNVSRIRLERLHRSLIPLPLKPVPLTYDTSDNTVERFDAEKALAAYQECLVPLHYHELWNEIVNDFKNVDVTLEQRQTIINFQLFYDRATLDGEENTALMFGTNRVKFTDHYNPLLKTLSLFDIVLITINNKKYFGIIVHVEQTKVKPTQEKASLNHKTPTFNMNRNELEFELQNTIGIYVSGTCCDIIREHHENGDSAFPIAKLSNITSSRRMISAIHNLNEWPQYRSLLKPTIDDIYFQVPDEYYLMNIHATNGFNVVQSQTIAIAECMVDDIQSRLHMVHGPPGTGKSRTIAGVVLKLLSKLPKSGNKSKILLCAPSNNACDELCRRILDEFHNQDIPYKHGTLVRIGCQPPDDYRLCDHFLDFMVLQEVVNLLRKGENPDSKIVPETEKRIVQHAKIVVSTLNYCGSTRMHLLKRSTSFIIIDEASQSLEADLLLPLRFKCTKIMLVGDPKQLSPCVLSDAGKSYNLSQSLYARLYACFQDCASESISMLNEQYRMHPNICRFPSDYFYMRRLRTDPSVAKKMRNFTLKPLFVYNLTKSFHEMDEAGSSSNKEEAKFIQYFCKRLITHLAEQRNNISSDSEDDEDDDSTTSSSSNSTYNDDDDSDTHEEAEKPLVPLDQRQFIEIQKRIAVITPYKAQIRLLRSYLPPYIEIMTADSAQGKEKDIVIISCVRSGGTIGFLDDMSRVNVMLTRSKSGLYVVGNLTQLANQHQCWQAFFNHVVVNKIICNVDTTQPDLPYR